MMTPHHPHHPATRPPLQRVVLFAMYLFVSTWFLLLLHFCMEQFAQFSELEARKAGFCEVGQQETALENVSCEKKKQRKKHKQNPFEYRLASTFVFHGAVSPACAADTDALISIS